MMARVFISLRTRRILLACHTAGAVHLLSGCQSAPLSARPELPSAEVTAYVVADGRHSDIALPVGAITGPLQAVTHDFPTAHYLRFGWGERDYYMAREPTWGDALHALFPSPAVLLVTPLESPPVGAPVFAIGFSSAGFARLGDYLWAAFDHAAGGVPRRLATGPQPGSVFYAATGTYSANHTCNTWTADALRLGGIPVTSAGVVFASQLTDQLRTLSGVVH